jgi:hypothetical protein
MFFQEETLHKLQPKNAKEEAGCMKLYQTFF